MKRRIVAWIYLILFVLLLVNIVFFRVLLAESVTLYALMIALFFLTRGFFKGTDNNEFKVGEGELDDGKDGERYEEGEEGTGAGSEDGADSGRDGNEPGRRTDNDGE